MKKLSPDMEKEFADAVKSRQKEAEPEDAAAQYFVGYCYYYGDGVSKDKDKAFRWLVQSAEQRAKSSALSRPLLL